MRLLSSFGVFLKTAIMATIADRHFHVFFEASESPNFLTCRQTCPFPKLQPDFLEYENPIISSVEFPVMPTVALQGLRKLD